jgi:hypothetical protein
MKSVSAFRLRDRIFVHPNCLTTAGLRIAAPDYFSLTPDADPEAVGQAISVALERSSTIVPHPASWAGLAKPRLQAAGLKSEAAFVRGARLVEVSMDKTELRLVATHNGGSKGDGKGFSSLQPTAMTPPDQRN